MAQVELQQVEKVYPGGVQAVDALSLRVEDGELMVLAGPSGSGKTTLLRLVAGLERATSGSISIGGRRVDGLPPRDRDVAMVFQDYALYPHLTAARNIGFALRRRGLTREQIAGRVRETAELLDVAALLDRMPDALSGGQQQRVALARAIARRPACMLLDEPLSNVDAAMRSQLRRDIKQLHQGRRTTTIYVTHDQEEALTLGDRLAVLSEGRLQQVGAPLDVYRRPSNSFVARFVGAPPMNLLPGRLRRAAGGAHFDDDQGVRLDLAAALPGDDDAVEAVLGVRPESLRRVDGAVAAGEHPHALMVELAVELCEPVGDRMDVTGTTPGGTAVRARIATDDAVRPGSVLRLSASTEAIHLFEPGSFGKRLDACHG